MIAQTLVTETIRSLGIELPTDEKDCLIGHISIIIDVLIKTSEESVGILIVSYGRVASSMLDVIALHANNSVAALDVPVDDTYFDLLGNFFKIS